MKVAKKEYISTTSSNISRKKSIKRVGQELVYGLMIFPKSMVSDPTWEHGLPKLMA